MNLHPVVSQGKREQLATLTMAVSAVPRALAWFVGAVIGSIVAGFLQGWRDAA